MKGNPIFWTVPAVQLPVLLVAAVSAAALIGLQGNGAAFLGVFPAVCLAALVLPVRLSALVAGVAVGTVSTAWLWNGRAPIAGIVLNDFEILAFFLLSLFARRLRESSQRAELLLAELEQTRAAQAQAAGTEEQDVPPAQRPGSFRCNVGSAGVASSPGRGRCPIRTEVRHLRRSPLLYFPAVLAAWIFELCL